MRSSFHIEMDGNMDGLQALCFSLAERKGKWDEVNCINDAVN